MSRFSRSAFYLRWRDVELMMAIEIEYVYLYCTRVKYRLDVVYKLVRSYRLDVENGYDDSLSGSAFYRPTFPNFSPIG